MAGRMTGRRPALDAATARRVREWARLGTTTEQVARTLGVSRAAVWRYIRGEHKHYHEERKA